MSCYALPKLSEGWRIYILKEDKEDKRPTKIKLIHPEGLCVEIGINTTINWKQVERIIKEQALDLHKQWCDSADGSRAKEILGEK